jgi:hypothetical protein
MANRAYALARTLEVCLLMRKHEKQAALPMAALSKNQCAQASFLNQAKLDASSAGNQLLPKVRNPIQNP